MPEEVRNLCRLADISSKSLLLQVVRQDTPEKMTALVEKIASQGGATRQQLREAAAKPKAGRPKHYVFAFRPPTKAFNLKLQLQQEPRVSATRSSTRSKRSSATCAKASRPPSVRRRARSTRVSDAGVAAWSRRSCDAARSRREHGGTGRVRAAA